mgnify:CR=1 FL=1
MVDEHDRGVDRETVERTTIVETGIYRGPHYYSHTPMIRIQLDLGRRERRRGRPLPPGARGRLPLLAARSNQQGQRQGSQDRLEVED